ncbi:exodeoxyribonuclease VII small subunit [Beggiatoa leptomitoformis]|uniref:Exodeoxyribonuclease VII small subunit n=1 Tax=Beggiatoa leptomitoformis TaxID=288004 RepID=A0A2N9YF94_9GAMM|nr:exodeoxyribonuclease VII small subunit [Beggiatoa leptomitoformis]ALG68522.1 exodeoxyribonuclease VII small subunit [Beggiatoa leptomitoformis]AUI69137.1 exodeoxyribonuclease VII small subunit [Beggiatoa leptomitoformis]
MAAKKSTDYQRNYNKLKTIAETMRQEEALDIDQLIPLVEEASKAYKACQERIAAVEKVLKTVE